jgi:hypothetical protein
MFAAIFILPKPFLKSLNVTPQAWPLGRRLQGIVQCGFLSRSVFHRISKETATGHNRLTIKKLGKEVLSL